MNTFNFDVNNILETGFSDRNQPEASQPVKTNNETTKTTTEAKAEPTVDQESKPLETTSVKKTTLEAGMKFTDCNDDLLDDMKKLFQAHDYGGSYSFNPYSESWSYHKYKLTAAEAFIFKKINKSDHLDWFEQRNLSKNYQLELMIDRGLRIPEAKEALIYIERDFNDRLCRSMG